jgi:hypothetical protein
MLVGDDMKRCDANPAGSSFVAAFTFVVDDFEEIKDLKSNEVSGSVKCDEMLFERTDGRE